MKKSVLFMIVAVLGIASVALAEPTLEKWSENHPEASKTLGLWVKAHPEAAAKFFEWDGHHPEHSREFVNWTIEHPAERIDVYVQAHPGEPYLDEIMKNHVPAAKEFMVWSRNHADAAKELMSHPKGLQWAGHHLYKEYWNLETK